MSDQDRPGERRTVYFHEDHAAAIDVFIELGIAGNRSEFFQQAIEMYVLQASLFAPTVAQAAMASGADPEAMAETIERLDEAAAHIET